MKAWIIAVGSEMLTPYRVDTNSLAITARLNDVGCDVRMKAVVADDIEELRSLFERGIGRVDLIVCTGGLGPTDDDLTRDAISASLGVPLEQDDAILSTIRARFERRGLTMPAINVRQAMVPRGGVVMANTRGTAPGLWLQRDRTGIALLPGPPREMQPMLDHVIQEYVGPRSGGRRLYRRVVRITGRPESDVDSVAQPVYSTWISARVPIATTILATMGQIELHLTASADDPAAAAAALDAAVEQLRDVLGPSVYSVDGESMEVVIGNLLRRRQMTIAVAESCSGGLLASRITDVPGSSDYFDRGVVCYSNEAKEDWLDVPRALIRGYGAVSEPVAEAMADGVRARAATDVGVGITGIAGPGGGTPEKPVGTVAIAVATPHARAVRTFLFSGQREMVKYQSAQAAMNMLRHLLAEPEA
jgi:nicotinamide-nucleotide amidase